MRLLICVAFGLVLGTSWNQPALAVEPDAPETLISRLDAVGLAVQQKLAEPFREASESETLARGALVEFYAEHGPVWVDQYGLTAKAKAAIKEIERADSYGLRAADYDLPAPVASEGAAPAKALALAEIKLSAAAVAYARHARGGRVAPNSISGNLDPALDLPDPHVVMRELAGREDPAAYLVSFQPQNPQFQALRRKLAELRGNPGEERQVQIPTGPMLRPGEKHAHVALLRDRLDVKEADGVAADEYGPALMEALAEFQKSRGLQADGILGPATRAALNGRPPQARMKTILVNMERWRWLPQDLGPFYVRLNIPEFLVRIVKEDKAIFTERTVVGKIDKQTPIISDEMEYLDFNPYWNVPNSIKREEILPNLTRGMGGFFGFGGGYSEAFLRSQNLYIKYNGRPIDPGAVDWSRVDIRNFHFYQPPGGGNVLGVVKFMFPNKHDVYMHDTPTKHLFDRTVRAESHGCMRIRNPLKMAEVILSHDAGWSMGAIERAVSSGANQTVQLKQPIPVHITYFTAWAGEDGEIRYFGDLYGHDSRMIAALGF